MNPFLKPGEYFYQLGQKNGLQFEVVALIAKPETPQGANYVLLNSSFNGNFRADGVNLVLV